MSPNPVALPGLACGAGLSTNGGLFRDAGWDGRVGGSGRLGRGTGRVGQSFGSEAELNTFYSLINKIWWWQFDHVGGTNISEDDVPSTEQQCCRAKIY